MKINYILEYVNKETNKPCRANIGYNISFARAAVFAHLKKGNFNIAILPILEDCAPDDPDNIEIIEVDCELKAEEAMPEC